MNKVLENEKQFFDYLLGDMTTAARDRFEERLFLEEDLSFALDAAENDLIDEYARGELSETQKRKFEKNFLVSGRRREKLLAAEILQRELFAEKPVSAAAPQVSFWEKLKAGFALPNLVWAGGLAAIALFLLAGGLLFLRQDDSQYVANADDYPNNSVEPTREISPLLLPNINTNFPESNADNPANKPEKPKPASSPKIKPQNETKPEKRQPPTPAQVPQPSRIFAFTLLPVTRSGRNPTLNISSETEIARLQVVHNNQTDFVKYRVELRNSDGEAVWTQEFPVNKKNISKPLVLRIENKLLKPDSYELTLLGITAEGQYEETNFYNFTVRQK